MKTVAVLFARADSVYKSLQGCDVWDIERDARRWPGGAPVVAHPPCRAWSTMRRFAKPRKGERFLATWALRQVRIWGGVLEHPAGSRLWSRAKLPRPGAGTDRHGGWTLGIHQHAFGHRAEKKTILYIVGVAPANVPALPPLQFSEPSRVVAHAPGLRAHMRAYRPTCTKAEREHTPPRAGRMAGRSRAALRHAEGSCMTLTETITWRPVAAGLPDGKLRTVLLALDGEGPCEGYLDGSEGGFPIWRGVDAISLGGYTVTHWAVLPKGPKP